MAAYTITASAVKWISGPKTRGIAGEAIAAGELVYLKVDGNYWKAQADGVDATDAAVEGMAVCSCAAGQDITVAQDGAVVQVDTALFAGDAIALFLHATAGKMGQVADLASTNYLTYVGFTTGTNLLELMIRATGLQVS